MRAVSLLLFTNAFIITMFSQPSLDLSNTFYNLKGDTIEFKDEQNTLIVCINTIKCQSCIKAIDRFITSELKDIQFVSFVLVLDPLTYSPPIRRSLYDIISSLFNSFDDIMFITIPNIANSPDTTKFKSTDELFIIVQAKGKQYYFSEETIFGNIGCVLQIEPNTVKSIRNLINNSEGKIDEVAP